MWVKVKVKGKGRVKVKVKVKINGTRCVRGELSEGLREAVSGVGWSGVGKTGEVFWGQRDERGGVPCGRWISAKVRSLSALFACASASRAAPRSSRHAEYFVSSGSRSFSSNAFTLAWVVAISSLSSSDRRFADKAPHSATRCYNKNNRSSGSPSLSCSPLFISS
jgi:hypothetical protein